MLANPASPLVGFMRVDYPALTFPVAQIRSHTRTWHPPLVATAPTAPICRRPMILNMQAVAQSASGPGKWRWNLSRLTKIGEYAAYRAGMLLNHRHQLVE
jgi:hypothetical protein